MNARSSGTIEVGVSKNGAAPSGSIVTAPSVAKKVAICCCAWNANVAPGPLTLVRNVCGFFATSGFAAKARSFRKSVALEASPPARRIALAVGFGTVLSPRANWMITGRVMNGAYAAGFAACCAHSVLSITVWIAEAGNRVHQKRQVSQRDVLVEVVEPSVGHSVVERRRTCEQREADEYPEGRAEPRDLDDRATRDVRDAGADVRLETEQRHAVDPAERLAGVVDPGRAEIGRSVAVDVDAPFQHLDELHQVDRRLAKSVAVADQGLRADGAHALRRVDRPVAILVDAAPADRKHDRRRAYSAHCVRAERAAAVPDDVDRDRRDATTGQRSCDCGRGSVLAVGEPVTEDRDGPAARRLRPGGNPQRELQVVHGLDGGHARPRPDRGDHLGRRLVV